MRRSWSGLRRQSDGGTNSSTGPDDSIIATPQLSRRKRFWNSFKKSTQKLRRSKSREKLKKDKENGRLARSSPNIAIVDSSPRQPRPKFPHAQRSIDFEDEGVPETPKRENNDAGYHDRCFSYPGMLPSKDSTSSPRSSRTRQLTRMASQEQSLGSSFDAGDASHVTTELTNGRESEVDSGITVVESTEATALRQRQNIFRQHPFFQLEINLKEGRDLVIRDSCGTSDPYVKFKMNGKQCYKSRIVYKNLNPKWDEKFTIPVEDAFTPVQVKVYDYDRGMTDDAMGSAEMDLTQLEPGVTTECKVYMTDRGVKRRRRTSSESLRSSEMKLLLSDKSGKTSEYMGYLLLECTIKPKSQDEKEQYFKKSMRLSDQAKKMKQQIWSSVVTIVLVEGRNLLPMDDNGLSDPYIKFRLGNEKYKSKFKTKTLTPRWLEQFDLHMFDDQTSMLEVSCWDHDVAGKDDFMGRAIVDLSSLDREVTHTLDTVLEDGAGIVKILLTISGTAGGETISDLVNYKPNPREREEVVCKYGLLKSFKGLKDIGYLQVKVFQAQNLLAADLGGKSDPFCVLELVNSRLQTQTEYKTLNPEWGKVFTFNVKDIHSVLEVTVYDEDRDKKAEFLGKVAIPILRVKNGEKKWYTLKDKKLMTRAKGAIQLELDFIYNHVKAAVRTVNPREEKYMQPEPKFKISIMKRNIDRVSKIVEAGVESGKFLGSCFSWESKPRSATAFAVFLIICLTVELYMIPIVLLILFTKGYIVTCIKQDTPQYKVFLILVWNFELFMLPITLLMVFLKNLVVANIVGAFNKENQEDEYYDEELDEEDEEKDNKEEKKSFKEKLQAVQDVCLQVQEHMDMIASMGERVKNTFNWTVPWLSTLAVIALGVGVIILYYIPLRYLIMAWGINKFTKKLRAPNAIPNNELVDFLSRVPSDKELIMFRELRPDSTIVTGKKKRQ